MEIQNNRIVGVDFRKSPNTSGTINPIYLIMHYTASSTASGSISWLTDPKSKVSAHLHIDRLGNIVQMVDFNRRAYHAGKSSWKGQSDLNWHSIGIELQNTGSQEYTDEQIKALIEVNKAIVKEYGIKEILGHDQISPGRKVDPGKQFPWARVRSESYERSIDSYPQAKYTTTDLHIREGAGAQHRSLGVLKKGTEVNALSEQNGWSELFVCSTQQHGWSSSRYLK